MIRLVSATGSFCPEYGSAQGNTGDSVSDSDIFQSNSPIATMAKWIFASFICRIMNGSLPVPALGEILFL